MDGSGLICSVLAVGVSLGQCCSLHQLPFVFSPYINEHGPAAAVGKQRKKKRKVKKIFIYIYIYFLNLAIQVNYNFYYICTEVEFIINV